MHPSSHKMLSSVATTVSLLQVFLAAYPQPTVLLTNLCWTGNELVEFNRQLPLLIRHVSSLGDIDEVDSHHVLILLNLNCLGVEEMLSNNNDKFNREYRWFLMDTSDFPRTEERVLQLFAQAPILQSSQLYFVSHFEEPSFQLHRVYRNSISTELIRETILQGNLSDTTFQWTNERGAVAISRQQAPGLAGTLINASLVITHNDSMNHLTDYTDKHLDTISKVNYLLTNDLIVYLNATVHYSIVSSWGYLNNETGHWDGMIGELVRGEAQVGASPLFFTADRVGTIQYLSMTSPTKSKFVFQAPKLSYTENVFLLPFGNVSEEIYSVF